MNPSLEEVKKWWKDRHFEGKENVQVPFGFPVPTIQLHEEWIKEWEAERGTK